MRLSFRVKSSRKSIARLKKKVRIRKKVDGTAERPRLTIFRSAKHIYAQIVDDVTGTTLVEASTRSVDIGKVAMKEKAKKIGAEVAKRALAKNIKNVVFDRSGYLYHGRVQSLAEGAREAGLSF